MNNKVIGLLGALIFAGLIAGCGNTTSTPTKSHTKPQAKSSPKASPSAKATPTPTTRVVLGSKLPSASTLNSNSYTFTMPSSDLTTAEASDPSELMMVGRNGDAQVTLPSDWEVYVPSDITVTNDTNGAVSNATAKTWAEGYLSVVVLDYWSLEYADAQLLENTTAPSGDYLYGGDSAVQAALQGTTNVSTGGIFPTHLYLITLNSQESQAAFGVSSPYAFVGQYPSGTTDYETTTTKAGVASKVSVGPSPSYVISGNYAAAPDSGNMPEGATGASIPWALGPVFNVTGVELCTSNTMSSTLCGDAGVN